MDTFEECTVFMHKGVEVHFSKSANDCLETDEHKVDFLNNFFDHEPMNAIKWVTVEEVMAMRTADPDAALPMYTIRNRKGDTLLIWPMLENANLYLYIEALMDRPDLLGELRLETI